MVNKRAGPPGADSVHPLIDTTGEINNFSIFSAEFDGDIGLGSKVF